MTYNPGLLFYRHYYEGIVFNSKNERVERENEKKFRASNKILLATRFKSGLLPILEDALDRPAGFLSFPLTTTYPGLVIGTGYNHGSGLLGEFKTGFYFDHTTGMPVIPGSTVKGLLRSTFPGAYYEKADRSEGETAFFWRKLGDNRTRFVASLIQALGYDLDDQPDVILRLERELFEGLHGKNREKSEEHFEMRDRDIFFDAVITHSTDGQVFSEEYITPHKNPLKNPIPIQILKVKPGVTFTFQFNLKAFYHVEQSGAKRPRLLTPAQRLELFRQILMFLGAGAKTNTGFGHFEEDRIADLSGNNSPADTDALNPSVMVTPGQKKENKAQETALEKVKKGIPVYAEVTRKEGNRLYFRLFVTGYTKEADCIYMSDKIQAGQIVSLRVNDVQGKGEKLKIIVAEPNIVS